MNSWIRRRLARSDREAARKAQREGRWADALYHVEKARRWIGNTPALALQAAYLQTEAGQFEAASESFSQALENPATSLRAAFGLAGLSERRQDWPGSLALWEAALARMAAAEGDGEWRRGETGAGHALLHAALCREKMGDEAGAERDLVLALALDPAVRRTPEAALMRAARLRETDPEAAYRLIRSATERFPDEIALNYERVRLGAMTGRRDEAKRLVVKLRQAAPDKAGIDALIKDYRL